ncbi:factor-independent urate hydroxylase [Halobacillus seohaensis]|uniref:Factor-independent urate hydroxylase n=1 Tax=Halobacillus seohaensis TaxID=447421 RepID=A0ABW2ENW5_9BACI
MVEMDQLNKVDTSEFVDILKDIFEHSAWVAVRTARTRPFANLKSLHRQMVHVVEVATYEEKLALIKSHPDLGSRVAMSTTSQKEQKSAGLNQLSAEEYKNFLDLNKKYTNRFGFPFIVAVRGKSKEDIYSAIKQRVNHSIDEEFEQALHEIYEIALLRLQEKITNEKGRGFSMKTNQSERTMSYGKGDVFAYRTYLKPLEGVKQIPESNFSGRNNIVFGLNVKVEIAGQDFLPSFTEGDNSLVVATDSMKNFIQRHLGSYEGSTIEGFIKYVGEAFLNKYAQIESVKLIGEEIPFHATTHSNDNSEAMESDLVFNSSRGERSQASIEMKRMEQRNEVITQSSKIVDLQLIKVKGNSFTGFVRDEYTTLPYDSNRPLFIHLNIDWEYEEEEDAYGNNPQSYVAAEQVKDIASSVFHELDTPSIQNLIYLIGCRILKRFPQLGEVTFQSQNHTWETVVDDIPNSEGKVYTEPRPPFGFQQFSVSKKDLQNNEEVAASGKASR